VLTARGTVEKACLLIGLGELFFLLVNPSYFGGIALRMIGIGGGIPTTIEFKSESHAPLSYVSGCLIIKLGNEVSILRMCHPSQKSCFISFSSSGDGLGEEVDTKSQNDRPAPETYPLRGVFRLRAPRDEDCDTSQHSVTP